MVIHLTAPLPNAIPPLFVVSVSPSRKPSTFLSPHSVTRAFPHTSKPLTTRRPKLPPLAIAHPSPDYPEIPLPKPHSQNPQPSDKAKPKKKSTLHRIVTKQDRKWIHKLSALHFILTTLGLLGSMPVMYFQTGGLSLPPNFVLEPLLTAWVVGILVQSASGTYMAIKYRRGNSHVRNAFIGAALSSTLNAWVAYWSSPILPDALSSHLLSAIVMGFLFTSTVALIVNTVITNAQLIESRYDKSTLSRRNGIEKLTDFMTYIFPNIWGLPFFVMALRFGVLHDHVWYLQQVAKCEALPAVAVYGNVLPNLAAGFGAFAVTLRDKKIISQKHEMMMIGGTSGIALASLLALSLHHLGVERLAFLLFGL